MIEYIHKRFMEWAAWSKRRDDGGLGYPKQAIYCNLMTGRGSGGSDSVVNDPAAVEIEHIIHHLRGSHIQHCQLATMFYISEENIGDIASYFGCCRDTVYARLHALHLKVMDELHEITIKAGERAALI